MNEVYNKNKNNKLAKYCDLLNPGLRVYLFHNEVGNKDIYMTPLFKGKAVGSVLKEWFGFLKSKLTTETFHSLLVFENDMLNKVGPMSYQLPLRDRLSDIEAYYTGITLPSEPSEYLSEGIAALIKE